MAKSKPGVTVSRETLKGLSEYGARKSMSLAIYRPQPHQEPFFRKYAKEYLLRGGVRAGKSLSASTLFSAIATDTPITFSDGTVMDMRQPWQKGRCLTMWVIGYDAKHIGQTIFRLLFKANAFKIIRDKNPPHEWRAYREWEPEDKAREREAKPAHPLIPNAFVDPKSWDWENRKGREFKSVTIWHPQTHEPLAQIFAFSSKAEPKQGDPVDVIWIDEAIQDPKHYEEWMSRIVDMDGRIFWSSWPKTDNNALQLLTHRAEACKNDPEPLVRELVISTSENKALATSAKDKFLAGLSEEARRARDRGEYLTDLQRAYPTYHKETHRVEIDAIDLIEKEDGISRELSKYDGIPPRDWTLELILDPGTAHPAALCCAIPPLNFGNYRIVYQEIYPGRADPNQLAELIKKRTQGQSFHRFIIDYRAGRQQTIGSTDTVVNNYIEAFKKVRLKSRSLGYRFVYGSDNVGARMGKLLDWLHFADGQDYPTLRIVNHRCPNLCEQMRDYKLACVNDDIKENRPAPNQRIDLAQCLEYWAASNPKYVPYSLQPEDGGAGYMEWLRTFGRKKRGKDSGTQIGPNYSAG